MALTGPAAPLVIVGATGAVGVEDKPTPTALTATTRNT